MKSPSFIPLSLSAVTLFIALLSPVIADNYRWTGAEDDGLWATAGNWEVEDAENPGVWDVASTAPGSGAFVSLGNAAPNQAQSIALTGNVEVAQVVMSGEGSRAYTLTGSEHTLSTTTAPLVLREATATAGLTIDVPLLYAIDTSFSLINQSSDERMVVKHMVEFAAPDAGTTTFSSGGTGLTEYQNRVFFTTGASNSRWTVGAGQHILFNYAGEGNIVNRQMVVGSGTEETPVNLYFARSAGLANRIWFLTSALGVANMQLFEAEDRDVVVSTGDLAGFSSSGPNSPHILNLLAPTDGSTGSLTLALTTDISTAGTAQRSIKINLDENTFIQLGRNQTLPNAVDVAGGIHGEGGLIKSGNTAISDIGDKNTYTGGTFIESNTLRLISGDVRLTRDEVETVTYAGTLGPGLLHVGSGGTFNMNNLDQTVAGLRNSPTDDTAGPVSLGGTAAGTLTLNTLEDSIFEGTVSGQGTVVKVGAGNQVLAGSIGFTGALDVNDGILTANGTIADTVTLSVGSNGILAGTGTIGAATQISGTLAPGNSPGTLTFTGDLGFSSNATVAFEIGVLENDLIALTGSTQTLSSNGVLNWNFATEEEIQLEFAYTLIDWSGATGLDLSGFDINDMSIANAGWSGDFSSDSDGLYVSFTAIPEPRLYAFAFGLIVCSLALLRRRRASTDI